MKKLATIIISGISNFIIYLALLLSLPFLVLDLFMDVDEDKAIVIFMFMGLVIGPIVAVVAAWLSGVTTKRVDKLNRQKKFIILSIQSLLAISIFIFLFKG